MNIKQRSTQRSARGLMALVMLTTVAAVCAPLDARADPVTITGQLTTFQSALDQSGNGDGTLNGAPLELDPSRAPITYPTAFNAAYPQSKVVTLAPGTLQAQFEYTSFIGTPNASPNRISFAAASMADVNVGDTFKVGTFTFTNGFWYPAAVIGFEITTHSANPALDNKTFEGSINVVVTNNLITVTDPVINADYFYLSDAAGNPLNALGSVRVYEAAYQPAGNPGNTGSVDLYARIGSLIPVRFDNATGGAFLQQSFDTLPAAAVPEPSTWAMSLVGLVGLLAWRRRQQPHASV
jgi:PEP-CTERM motif